MILRREKLRFITIPDIVRKRLEQASLDSVPHRNGRRLPLSFRIRLPNATIRKLFAGDPRTPGRATSATVAPRILQNHAIIEKIAIGIKPKGTHSTVKGRIAHFRVAHINVSPIVIRKGRPHVGQIVAVNRRSTAIVVVDAFARLGEDAGGQSLTEEQAILGDDEVAGCVCGGCQRR